MSMRNYIREDDDMQQEINSELDADTRRSFQGMWWALVGLLLYIGLWCATTNAATTIEDSMTIQLRRGSSIVTLVPAPATLADCEQRKAGLIAIDAETRFSGTATYSCIETRRSVVTFTANPPPPPPPPPVDCVVSDWGDWVLGTPSACVDGSQTRTDTRTRTITTPAANGGAACPELSESRTETLSCAVEPPPLTAPTLAQPTHEPNATNADRFNVLLSWSAVPGADAYRVNRCVGTNCSTMSVIVASVPGTTYKNTNVPATTYKYQIYARRGTTEIGPASNLVVYTVTAAPPPTSGTAALDWEAPTTNTDGTALTNLAGWRIEYGPVEGAGPNLNRSVSVNNAAVSAYTVEGLTSGTWAFAVRAVTATGVESMQSNYVTRQVP